MINENTVKVLTHDVFSERIDRFKKDVCELKHKEVDDVKTELKDFRDCVTEKFTSLHKWVYGLMGVLLVNLILLLVKLVAGIN